MKDKLKNIKHTGYNAPEGYFSELEDSVLNKIKLDDTLGNTKSPGFNIPDDYFNTLEDTILTKVTIGNETKVVSIFTKRNLIYISGVAAAVLIFFSIFLNNTITIDNVDLELVESYIMEENIDSYEIAALLEEDELVEEAFTNDYLEEESLEDYILENASIEDLLIE